MELTVKLVIDASPNLEKLVTWLVSKTQPTAVLTEAKADALVAPVAEQPAAPTPEAKQPEKPKEITDADMRKVVGPFVQANGPDKIVSLLIELGVTTNRTTDLPQDKRQLFIDRIKAMS